MSEVERFVAFCESAFGSTVMDREAEYVAQYIDPADRVLDVGCGIGALETRLAEYDIIGVDRSKAMARAARERTVALILRGDARALPIQTGEVDVIVFVATLAFIADIEATLSEAMRVLTPDGMVIALVLNTRSAYVRSKRRQEGSYFQRMTHEDSDKLVTTLFEYIDGTQEYIVGVEDEIVIDRADPQTATTTAVVGSPASPVES